MQETSRRNGKEQAMVAVYIVLAIIFVVLLWALMRVRRGRSA
jgi:flagellar biogenesis protein FliO